MLNLQAFDSGALGFGAVVELPKTISSIAQSQTRVGIMSLTPEGNAQTLTMQVVDRVSGSLVAANSVPVPNTPAGALVVTECALSADQAKLVAVVSVSSLRSDAVAVEKTYEGSDRTRSHASSSYETARYVTVLDIASSECSTPTVLGDSPTLARINLACATERAYVWTIADLTHPAVDMTDPPVLLTVFDLEMNTVLSSFEIGGQWPVSGQQTGVDPATNYPYRLCYGNVVEVVDVGNKTARATALDALSAPQAQVGRTHLAGASSDGFSVHFGNATRGAWVSIDLRDPTVQRTISFPPPANSRGPLPQIATSSDATMVFVGASADVGGISAYDASTGKLMGAYSDGVPVDGVTALPSGDVLAVYNRGQARVARFGPDLAIRSSLDLPIQVSRVF